jgi:transcriptional regulator with XRE-family HTH domain
LITGNDIRRYRKALGLRQAEFASLFEISQSAFSRLESGKIAVSGAHFDFLKKRFRAPEFDPTFADFVRQAAREKTKDLVFLDPTVGRHLLLSVWQWEEGFDLTRAPNSEQAVGLVTIPATDKATIAFQMPRSSQKWLKGDIFVFEESKQADVREGDLCLVHYQRGRNVKTNLAEVAEDDGTALHVKLVGGRQEILPNESIAILLRAIMRIQRFQ